MHLAVRKNHSKFALLEICTNVSQIHSIRFLISINNAFSQHHLQRLEATLTDLFITIAAPLHRNASHFRKRDQECNGERFHPIIKSKLVPRSFFFNCYADFLSINCCYSSFLGLYSKFEQAGPFNFRG